MSNTADYYDHPVLNNQVFINTPAMRDLEEVIHQWIWHGIPGGMVIGDSRMGKSWAARSLEHNLYSRAKVNIPSNYISIGDRDQPTIATVFKRLCHSVNLRVTTRSTADMLCDSYLNYVKDRVVKAGCPHYVLIVDEAQLLLTRQFNAFMEIFNELDKDRGLVTLHIIFVFSRPECQSLLEKIRCKSYTKIRARFLTQKYEFRGITTASQVKYCLSQYDRLCFPKNGPTYTEYFLPEQYKEGWRLACLAKELWQCFLNYKLSLKLDAWAMQYFISAVNALLCDYLPQLGVENLSQEKIQECIALSGIEWVE